jgi:hypothetical protein
MGICEGAGLEKQQKKAFKRRSRYRDIVPDF